jgi:hypothetical protein
LNSPAFSLGVIVTMSKLLEFFLGSIVVTIFTVAFLFFSALHYILRGTDVADCVWQGSAKAWIDSNRDGLVNSDEPPLSNVEIHIDDVQNQRINVSWPVITDHDGDVKFSVSIPGCSNPVFQIYVKIPEGYRMTTRPRIEVNPDFWEIWNPESVYYFGFVSDK